MPKARRRRLSMTSLIDVIFLLLLFFMLTSTFSKFSEVELTSASQGAEATDAAPLFLQLMPQALRLNGDALTLGTLATSQLATADSGTPVLVSLDPKVDAQRLTDMLVALRQFPKLRVTVLGG